jgi:hypothetical protein
MFVDEARGYPKVASLGWAPALQANIILGYIRLARDKHSSLLRKSINYGRKKFIVQAPGQKGPQLWQYWGLYCKTFYTRNCCCIVKARVFATTPPLHPRIFFLARLEPIRVEPLVGLYYNDNACKY